MIARRDLIFGGAFAAAAAGAYALKPRKKISLLGNRKMAAVVPTTFGRWESQTAEGLVQPETEGKLAAKLYSEMVSRIYHNGVTGDAVMMLIAYGDTQSDLLQLHRPEACYPAVGFRLALSEETRVPLGNGAILPARRVVAERTERRENIIYWTRLGEFLPASEGSQREARLLTAMKGYIPDGALFRFSTVRDDGRSFSTLDSFIASMIHAVAPATRPALVGTALAKQIVGR
jgi:EpsI family protein